MSVKSDILKNIVANFKFESDWKMKDLKNEIKRMLGEEVGVEINYVKDVKINEVLNKAEEVRIIENINITFTDDDDNLKSVSFKYNLNDTF